MQQFIALTLELFIPDTYAFITSPLSDCKLSQVTLKQERWIKGREMDGDALPQFCK